MTQAVLTLISQKDQGLSLLFMNVFLLLWIFHIDCLRVSLAKYRRWCIHVIFEDHNV